jgi:predicted nuclease with TOPRIM domain
MTDIMELIEKYAETHAQIMRDLEKWGQCNEDARKDQQKRYGQLQSHISAMQEVCDKVKEVYEKYKHLDELLSDREFLDEKNIKAMILYDLWQAIKE